MFDSELVFVYPYDFDDVRAFLSYWKTNCYDYGAWQELHDMQWKLIRSWK